MNNNHTAVSKTIMTRSSRIARYHKSNALTLSAVSFQ